MSQHEHIRKRLEAEHRPKAIRQRLDESSKHVYLKDAILGGIDGGVTSFAVVAAAVGAALPEKVVIILGFANLLADGFSMAASNYLGTKSQSEHLEKARQRERFHIEHVPEGEREEIRQIFAKKGFEGEDLEKIVDVITHDHQLWVDTMLTEELGLQIDAPRPLPAAGATFGAFLGIGLIPLIPYVLPILAPTSLFLASAVMTALAFTGVGLAKGWVLDRPLWRSGLETLLIGGVAAVLAYAVGAWLRHAYGIA